MHFLRILATLLKSRPVESHLIAEDHLWHDTVGFVVVTDLDGVARGELP